MLMLIIYPSGRSRSPRAVVHGHVLGGTKALRPCSGTTIILGRPVAWRCAASTNINVDISMIIIIVVFV